MSSKLLVPGLAAIHFLCLTHAADAAESASSVPPPSRVFTPRTALAVYANVQGASQSAIWKVITNKFGPLAQQFEAMQKSQPNLPQSARAFSALEDAELAEIAFALDGDKALNALQGGELDPGSSFLIVARLAKVGETDDLIQSLLGAIEKPELRSQIEKSRQQVGAAAFYDIPAEVFEGEKLPFKVGIAIGPGASGTVLAFGRSDTLRDFVLGKTEGALRGRVNETLNRRGQVWIYFPVPKDATKNLAAGAGDLNANPMLAGLAQGLEKVQDVSLTLNFGASQVDLQINFGCADSAAAAQLSQTFGGLLGFIQMGAAKDPAAVPPFVGKIKGAADAAAFRLTTAFTARDFDMLLQNISRQTGLTAKPTPVAKAQVSAPAEPEITPVTVEFVEFAPDEVESLRRARMRIGNRSAKGIREVNVTFIYLDGSNRKLGQWTRTHPSLTENNLVNSGVTNVVDCLAFNVPPFTKTVTSTLNEVTFADGEKLKPSR